MRGLWIALDICPELLFYEINSSQLKGAFNNSLLRVSKKNPTKCAIPLKLKKKSNLFLSHAHMNEREETVEVRKHIRDKKKNIQTIFFYIAISGGIF